MSGSTGFYEQYRRSNYKLVGILGMMILMIGVLSIFSIANGSYPIPPEKVLRALTGRGEAVYRQVVWQLRLPRVLTAILAGFGLGASGCVLQSLLDNPLASASTLGVSQGASFGAAFSIICLGAGSVSYASGTAGALSVASPYLTTICAFAGSMLVTLLVLALSRLQAIGPSEIVLMGVAMSSIFSGATALMQYFADDVDLSAIVFWTFGDLGRATYREVFLIAVVVFGACICFFFNVWNYNALSAGKNTAMGLGVNVSAVRLIGLTLSSLVVAVIVSFVGIINFIGLVAPHIMRRILGTDHRFLLPGAMLCGAVLLLVSDLFARLIISPVVLPIGAITSFMGAPLFLYILLKGSGKRAGN